MTLSSAPPLRRGSTPVPFKYQLRREEAVNDDCDWTPEIGVTEAASPPPVSFVPAEDEAAGDDVEDRRGGPFRIALLGQNGVGKTSLAIALTGEMDRTASVDSDGEGYVRIVTVDNEESTVFIFDNWRQFESNLLLLLQDLSTLVCEVCLLVFSVTDRRSFHRTAQLRLLLRENQPQTPIILVGNKSDLVRSREVSTEVFFFCLTEARSNAALYESPYVELSASLDHGTTELLELAVRAARGESLASLGVVGAEGATGGRRESLSTRAKRFLSSLVPRYPKEKERDGGKFFRQKSRSCHDLGAL
ncbi:GTP-binding protein REM 2, partial [Silurus asotus]